MLPSRIGDHLLGCLPLEVASDVITSEVDPPELVLEKFLVKKLFCVFAYKSLQVSFFIFVELPFNA